MRCKKALTGFTGVSMALLLASQVFAQPASIEGWDKAKLGMSVKELKESYRKEAQKGEEFWKETTPPESKLIGCTRLSTSCLKTSLGMRSDIDFWFIDNKLWVIQIHIPSVFSSEKVKQFINSLTSKYGKPYEEPDIFGNSYEWYREGRQLMVWTYLDSEEKISSVDVFYTDGELNELWKKRYDEWTSKQKKRS